MDNTLDKDLFWSKAEPINIELLKTHQCCLIMVPHPDDESLGCAGLIATLIALGKKVKLILTTDGSKSHPNSKKFPKETITALRLKELKEAMTLLGLNPDELKYYNAPDASMPAKGAPGFTALKEQLKEDLIEFQPDLILVPYELDPHCDHRSTYQLLIAALEIAHIKRPKIWEYPIWLYEHAKPEDLPDLQQGELKSLDIKAHLSLKKRCIYAHRSQTTRMIDDDPDGFILTDQVINNFMQEREFFLERLRINPSGTLSPSYFEKLYSSDRDPWNFETSEYEQLKYQKTIENIPEQNYGNALEIGCSIGVLTAMLAPKCKRLVAMDISAAAIKVAKERLGKNPTIELRTAAIPQDYPEECFDLIIMSEVGYYLSKDDLLISRNKMIESLNIGGIMVLVHWIHFVADYPLNGDQVHECFLESDLNHLNGYRESNYRLDVFQK